MVTCGKQKNKDRENYIPKQLNPIFGRYDISLVHVQCKTKALLPYDPIINLRCVGRNKTIITVSEENPEIRACEGFFKGWDSYFLVLPEGSNFHLYCLFTL